MQNFVDSRDRFVFPEHLFPEVTGPILVPPSVGSRRAAIVRGAAAASAFMSMVTSPSAEARNVPPELQIQARDWSRSVVDFHALWAPLAPEIVEQAMKVLEVLARTFNDGIAAYVLGATPTKSSGERRSYLRQALKLNVHRAWYRVGVNSDARGDVASALSRFQRGADRNDSACLYTLGLAYLQGQLGLTKDIERGVNLVELALNGEDSDFPRASYLLGKIMLGEGAKPRSEDGLGMEGVEQYVPLNYMRGLDLVERSAVLGFAPALFRMAEAYLNPAERGFDCLVALRFLSLAACQDTYRRFNQRSSILGGAPEAQIVKWLLCGYENVLQKNEEWAFRFAEVSALDNNASALFALAYFYEVGIAVKPDTERSLEYYKMSSERGFPAAVARLEQLNSSAKPQLRRTLTRVDHDAKLQKHKSALIRGGAIAASAAIADESTLVPADHQSNLQPQFPADPKTTRTTVASDNQTSTAGAPPSPTNSVKGLHIRAQSTSVLPYPASPNRLSTEQMLPYPADSPQASPWQSPKQSPKSTPPTASPANISPVSVSPRSSSMSLPYPRSPNHSPEIPNRSPNRSPSPVLSDQRNVSQPSLNNSISRKPAPVSAAASAPPVPNTQRPFSAAAADSGKRSPPSQAARQGPAVLPVPSLQKSLQNAPTLHPTGSTESFQTAHDVPYNQHSPQLSQSQQSQPLQQLQQKKLKHPASSASLSSRVASQPPSSVEALNIGSARAPSPTQSNSRSNSPRRRPLSAQWMRHSIVGASRFFSSSQASLTNGNKSASPSPRGGSPAPSLNSASTAPTTSDLSSEAQSLRRSSQSPLRKIFGSTPEQRAAVARADRRSFTEQALAELASVPKVPVQPIKTDRTPGVAYTFEEMGVKPVTSDKNEKCVIQ